MIFYQKKKENFYKFLNFEEKNKIYMHIFRNSDLRKTLIKIIKKKKNIKIIRETVTKINYEKSSVFLKNKNLTYNLIILCLGNKSQLYNTVIDGRSIEKNYKEVAITSLVNHNFVIENASQFFFKGSFCNTSLEKKSFFNCMECK